MELNATSTLSGGKNIYDAYPYEYKTPLLMPVNFNVTVPFGYYVSAAWIRNLINFPSGGTAYSYSDTVGMHLADTTGNIVITSADLPPLECFTQHSTQAGNDTLFFGDQYNSRSITLQLMPLPQLCIDTLVKLPYDSTCRIGFNIQAPSCLQSGVCSQANISKGNGQMNALGVNPDLIWNGITNSNALLNSDTVCWRGIKIENQNTTQPALTQADNVYLALIDSSAPYLTDWHFIRGAQVIYPNGNVIGITAALPKGATVTGDLCARVAGCPNDTLQRDVLLHYGWNCGSYPASPYDSATVCEFSALHLSFKKAETSFYSLGKTYETPYTLCDTVTVTAPFYSAELGYVYPDSVVLQNLNAALQIANVSITGSATAPLTPTAQPTVWLIGAGNMTAAGFPEGGFNNGGAFMLQVDVIPSCTFAGDTILPDFIVYAHDFCGHADTANADFSNSPVFYMNTSQSACNDCWSITKTASTDSIAAGNTVTYTITVCNNSANTQTGVLSDIMQGGFVVTATTLPGSVTLNPMQCDTFTVSGYFTQYGSCFYNVATVTSPANTTWQDSVCVEVVSPCANTDTTFADSTTFAGTDTITGESIFVAGTFFVNGALTLNNCMVYVNAGGQITVQGGGNLILNNTTIQSCDTMWRGITVLASGKLKLNGSTLKDADNGIYAVHQSQVEILQSEIYDCVTGLMIPPRPSGGYNSIVLKVDGSRFKMQAANFKPDYAGQPAHGIIPKAGIDITNMITTIGATNLNEFDKLNAGIVAKSCIITVKRSMFTNIQFDTFYTEPYRGTAIVSVGMPVGDIHTGSLTVLPEATAYNTVDNCYRGIYTDKSALFANYIHILNVTHGVFGTNIGFQQTATVSNSVITASSSGLAFVINPFAKAVYLASNEITINGVNNPNSPIQPAWYGIQMRENNVFATVRYNATNNTIHLNKGTYGIYSGMLNRANIKFNVIRITGNGYGINAQTNLSTSVSCNTINGNYTAGLSNSYGISIGNLSYNTSMYCNSVDSTYRGIYFGGTNPSTYLKATEFHHHYTGLYLNNAANISWQTLYGNRWNNANISFQAYNANTFGYTSSLFFVDTALGNMYSPTNNIPGNNGWFRPFPGNTFHCSNSSVCATPPVALTDSVLNLMIANGTLESEEYAEESRAIAEEYLFRQLMEDSTLIEADSAYAAFMEENMGEPVEYLYNAEEYLRAAYEYDSVFVSLIDSCYSQIEILTDSIKVLEEIQPEGWDAMKDQLLYTISFLNQTINNLYIIREATINNNLSNAELQNDYVVSAEIPEINTAYMNEIEINFLESGGNIEVLQNNYAGIYSIASQCPYSGGRAVEKARSFMALLNDTISYNDNAVCLQSGIFRYANDSIKTVEENQIIIQPNPASNEVSIILKGNYEGLCNVQIQNVIGETVLTDEMNCKDSVHKINLSNIPQGIYMVKVNINNSTFVNTKLVIIR